MTRNKNKRKRWLKNRLRIQRKLDRQKRFNDSWDKIFKVGRYKDGEQ